MIDSLVKNLQRENLKYFNYVVHILPLLLVFTFWEILNSNNN